MLRDADRLQQIVCCVGTIKFTESGGTSARRGASRRMLQPEAIVSSGPGIPATSLPHTFEAPPVSVTPCRYVATAAGPRRPGSRQPHGGQVAVEKGTSASAHLTTVRVPILTSR